jgi:lysozyme
MRTSTKGIKMIEQREGIRLGAYRDSRGLWTIGVGHLSDAYFHVSPGMVISEAKALDLLAHDLGEVEATIAHVVKVPLQQWQFDALASLGYNIGCGGLAHSTVVHFVNAKSFTQAADAFMNWVHPPELRGRRESERRQFLGA